MNNTKIKGKAIDRETVCSKDDKLMVSVFFSSAPRLSGSTGVQQAAHSFWLRSRQVVWNLNEFTHHLAILYLEASSAIELGWGLRVCIAHKLPGGSAADASPPWKAGL